jgi:chloramphenicol O-acetyltransferase type A
MKNVLDISNWVRKDHFHFFRQFEEPFFGVTVHMDCTHGYAACKQNGVSFFLYYLHASLTAANNTEPFKYRVNGDEVFVYDFVNASPTINRPDGTFGFAYMDYKENFGEFAQEAQAEIDKVRNSKGLIPAVSGENVIHYSSIPWTLVRYLMREVFHLKIVSRKFHLAK